MKNLVVFISPRKRLYGEYAVLAEVWVDNSLDLGWDPDDLLLVTNFGYQYNGVRSVVVGDEHFVGSRPRSIKTAIIPHLVDAGLVREGEVFWNHDLDAFQLNPFTEADLGLDGVDLGLTDYGWKPRWCMGSYFFKKGAVDLFRVTRRVIVSDVEDEDVMLRMEAENTYSFASRHKRLNITWNFGMRNVEENWARAEHPIRVVHFHPTYKLVRTWDVFVLGKNGLGHPIINDRLTRIFKDHGMG